jgi:hypothetical protein
MKLAIVGPGRSGKDECALWLDSHTPLRYSGFSTSRAILPHAARRLGISEAEAWATRHERRAVWRVIGDELRRDDPAFLAREALRHGDICVGIRARCEMEAAQREGLVDLTIWVDRDVPVDDTLEFSRDVADIILPNHWGIEDLHGRLRRLAISWGLPVACPDRPSSPGSREGRPAR